MVTDANLRIMKIAWVTYLSAFSRLNAILGAYELPEG